MFPWAAGYPFGYAHGAAELQWMPEHGGGPGGSWQWGKSLTFFKGAQSMRLNITGLRKSLSRDTRSMKTLAVG